MNTKDMLDTLGRCKTLNPKKNTWTRGLPDPVNWIARNSLKLRIFLHNLAALVLILIISYSLSFLIGADAGESIGQAWRLSIWPMLFVTLTWMLPAWKFFDRKALLLPLTLGMMPIRVIAAICYVNYIVPAEVSQPVLFTAMMIHWILFYIPEASMMWQFSQRLQMTEEEEPLKV